MTDHAMNAKQLAGCHSTHIDHVSEVDVARKASNEYDETVITKSS